MKRANAVLLGMVLAILAAIPLFLHLGTPPIQIWDESRLATNAVEMAQNGDWITTHFNGKPDLWNTKPPLMIWLQVACIKTLGVNEWAIRFPAALAALLTVLCLFLFSKKVLNNGLPGFFAGLVLVSSLGYVTIHRTRTGDYDALLTFFITWYTLAYFAWTEKPNNKTLLLFFVGLTLAVLTKSVAGLLMLPALFIYTIATGQLGNILKQKTTWLGVLAFGLVVGGYYLLREHHNPGYIATVLRGEFKHGYLVPDDGHTIGFWFYFIDLLYAKGNLYWTIWACFAILFIPKGLGTPEKRLNTFLIIATVSFLVTISFGAHKHAWYDAPVYPIMALLVGCFLFWVANLLQNSGRFSIKRTTYLTIVALVLILGIPYGITVGKYLCFYAPDNRDGTYNASLYIKEMIRSNVDLSNVYYVSSEDDPQNRFYLHVPNQKNQHIKGKTLEQVAVGDQIIAFGSEATNTLANKFTLDTLATNSNLLVGHVVALRPK